MELKHLVILQNKDYYYIYYYYIKCIKGRIFITGVETCSNFTKQYYYYYIKFIKARICIIGFETRSNFTKQRLLLLLLLYKMYKSTHLYNWSRNT